MTLKSSLSCTAAAAAFFALGGVANAQYVENNSGNPGGQGNASFTENVDFGDVDLDGDWDAVFADGGDAGNDQNRIWINRGGAQGATTGDFDDQTNFRFPQQQDDSRDIEFADIDNDGDLDIYVSNTAQLVAQGNKWWVNVPGGANNNPGFFVDETTQRWVGLGVNNDTSAPGGSSIAPGLVGQGTFLDWSCDCDFGDLDNDGDLDLVHSSYGGAFGGQVPTRLFLNDGEGRFEEFNPQGNQLTANSIGNNQPAIWAEGVQQSNAENLGAAGVGFVADIASSALDIDVGDIDGDFDLDILHGARQEAPRMFRNNLDDNEELPAFTDVTAITFTQSHWNSADNYEQEMGDFDGDGDLDIYGLNWIGFSDQVWRNQGNGVYDFVQQLPSSGADDNEGDFVDYDNDGDLDLFVANFSGNDKLYRNNDGNGSYSLVQSLGSTGSARSLDLDAADIDQDGDYDAIVAEDANNQNSIFINTTNIPDTHAPYIPNVENLGDRTATTGVFPIRAQVYDNAPYYITWYNPTTTTVEVDGFEIAEITSMSSQGQIFRTEMPANLVGSVAYSFTSSDEYGNTGSSDVEVYNSTYGPAFQSSFGAGTAGAGGTPEVRALSFAAADQDLFLGIDGIAGNTPGFFILASAGLPAPLNLPGIGNINITGNQFANIGFTTNGDGEAVIALPVGPSVPAGFSAFAQVFGLDGTTTIVSTSNGLEIITQ
ncbi:MAG: VCBS repeat-containing protein [Planctomycetota bacterium]